MLSAYSPFTGPPIRRQAIGGASIQKQGAMTPAQDNIQAPTPDERKPLIPTPVSRSPEIQSVGSQTNPQGREKLALGAVVQDVRRTMAALGTDDETQRAVEQYLNVTILEAQKETPSAGLMKGLLKSASDRLDQSISDSLGQPSRVVRDWMEAVLLQDVNFKQVDAGSASAGSTLNQTAALVESAQSALSEGQPHAAASAWRKLIAVGDASLSSREAGEALSTFKSAAELAKKLNQPESLKTSLSGMVKAYIDLNQHDIALKVLQVADRLSVS